MSLVYAPEKFKFIPYVKSFDLNDGIKNKNKKRRLSPTQIRLYGYIYSWFEAGYFCEVSEVKISEYLGCATSTVEVAIKRLEELGWVHVEHGKRPDRSAKNECNVYTIKRKPKALKTVKAEKKPIEAVAEATPKKTEAEIKNSTIYAISKMMNQININYDDKKWIEQRLRGY